VRSLSHICWIDKILVVFTQRAVGFLPQIGINIATSEVKLQWFACIQALI